MCHRQAGVIESLLLEDLQSHPHTPLSDLYGRLSETGVCLEHLCRAAKHLCDRGKIASSEEFPVASSPDLDSLLGAVWLDEILPAARDEPLKARLLPGGFLLHLDEPLGHGSAGTVYRGEQLRLHRSVAIKVCRFRNLAAGASRNAVLERFRREPLFLASLNHPHIVQVLDCGEDEDRLWFAMELLVGGTLADRIDRGPLPPAEVRSTLIAIASALGEAARHGILHRDVKPGNIFMQGPKLADFGLAKGFGPPPPGGTDPLTRPATVLGTLPYLSPERGNGEPGDARSDIYSLGASMYHAATGRFLFDLKPSNRVGWLKHHAYHPPRPIRHLVFDFPNDLAEAIERCLQKAPERRFPDFDAFLEGLGP